MTNIRISQAGVRFLQDLDQYLQEADLVGQDPTKLFREAQTMGTVLRILEDAPDEGYERQYLYAIAERETAWMPEKVKRVVSDLYRHGKLIELYDPEIHYHSAERELGSRKIDQLRRVHAKDQWEGRKEEAWCEKCQKYHYSKDKCPYCE